MNEQTYPIGEQFLTEILKSGQVYIDKTQYIPFLLRNKCYFLSRPRRFGKTLNMSMLKAFFEIGTDKSLFDSLEISREREICAAFQGQYPVFFLSLKEMGGKPLKMQ